MAFLVRVVIGLIFYSCIVTGETSEPTCYSRFDFDEKMLLKLLKIEDKIQKFNEAVNEMKESLLSEQDERKSAFDSAMNGFKVLTNEEVQSQKTVSTEARAWMERVKNDVHNLTEQVERNMKVIDDKIKESIENQASKVPDVVFTVSNPVDSSTTGIITFSTVTTNEGDGFHAGTGEFRTPLSGLYYFITHLVKKRDQSKDQTGCYICKNGSNIVRAHIDPADGSTDGGSYGVSNSAFLRLNKGDVVSLCSCYNPSGGPSSTMHEWSSFSGYLIRPNAE